MKIQILGLMAILLVYTGLNLDKSLTSEWVCSFYKDVCLLDFSFDFKLVEEVVEMGGSFFGTMRNYDGF